LQRANGAPQALARHRRLLLLAIATMWRACNAASARPSDASEASACPAGSPVQTYAAAAVKLVGE